MIYWKRIIQSPTCIINKPELIHDTGNTLDRVTTQIDEIGKLRKNRG